VHGERILSRSAAAPAVMACDALLAAVSLAIVTRCEVM
jgi:hypothetical protein